MASAAREDPSFMVLLYTMNSLALVIFGITSNLAQIKLIPALYDMAEKGLLPDDIAIIGTARGEKTHQELLDYLDEIVHKENRHHKHAIDPDVVKKLLSKFHYVNGNLDDPDFYVRLKEELHKLGSKNRIFLLGHLP